MTMLEVKPTEQSTDEKLTHWACCETNTQPLWPNEKALCGTDITGQAKLTEADPITCAACNLVETTDNGYCPRYGRCHGGN